MALPAALDTAQIATLITSSATLIFVAIILSTHTSTGHVSHTTDRHCPKPLEKEPPAVKIHRAAYLGYGSRCPNIVSD